MENAKLLKLKCLNALVKNGKLVLSDLQRGFCVETLAN
jgi:hypothetical protein